MKCPTCGYNHIQLKLSNNTPIAQCPACGGLFKLYKKEQINTEYGRRVKEQSFADVVSEKMVTPLLDKIDSLKRNYEAVLSENISLREKLETMKYRPKQTLNTSGVEIAKLIEQNKVLQDRCERLEKINAENIAKMRDEFANLKAETNAAWNIQRSFESENIKAHSEIVRQAKEIAQLKSELDDLLNRAPIEAYENDPAQFDNVEPHPDYDSEIMEKLFTKIQERIG